MRKVKLIFVILQHNSSTETIKCVKSIFKTQNRKEIEIVIVDNGSKNSEILRIKKTFSKNKKIHFLINKKNFGFSRGNNLGCEFAIKNFNPDFLYVINNDTLIEQKNIIKSIENEYKKSRFDILGPDILDLEGSHTNPFIIRNLKRKNIKKRIFLGYIKLIAAYIGFYYVIKKIKGDNKRIVNWKERKENVGLYACALIFSKKYFKRFKKIFDPEVFLYGEEDFLEIKRRKFDLKFVYSPLLKITHLEERSSKNKKGTRKQYIFRLKNILKSDKTMLRWVRED